MSNRPTITDLAKAAGVSPATVDRVLNKRTKVREATSQRVLLAAEDLGYHATGLLKQRVRESKPVKRLVCLLQRSNDTFYQLLGLSIQNAFRQQWDFQFEVSIVFMDEVSPNYITAQLQDAAQYADAIGLVALDDSMVNMAMEQIIVTGKPIVTILSPVSNTHCTGHVGLDSRKAGRTAAWSIARLAPKQGKIGILLGSHRYLNQEIAEISFINYFRSMEQQARLLEPIINLDDAHLAAEATAQLLADHADLVALYSAGGGVDGIIRVLRETQTPHKITVICNELTTNTKAALSEGLIDLVIATPIHTLAEQLVSLFTRSLKHKSPQIYAPILLTPELYIAENI